MTVFSIIGFLIEILMVLYVFFDLILDIRNAKYQKLWNLKKGTLVRIDLAITRAELCEQYVNFRKEHDCNVEF